MMDNTYYIGKISTTHRLFGTVKLSTNFQNIEQLIEKDVIISKDDDIQLLKIKDIKSFNGKKALVDFYNITKLEDAKKILNYSLYIRKDLIEDFDDFYDIIGYRVFYENKDLGEVKDIMETSAHDILVVGDKEILIPYIDVFVKNIDDDKKIIEVELIEGMI